MPEVTVPATHCMLKEKGKKTSHRTCRCKLVSRPGGKIATCQADPLVGQSCEDNNACTTNDQCVFNSRVPGIFDSGIRCRGAPTGQPCDDENACTDNDVCKAVPVPNQTQDPERFDGFNTTIICRGDTAVGRACTLPQGNTNPCFEEFFCEDYDVFGFPAQARCLPVPLDNTPCDDGNACTTGDRCVKGGGRTSNCQGTPLPVCIT
jgi:hypothetical protein